MKYLKSFESVRDMMTPKSEEEIKENIKKLNPNKKLMLGIENGLIWVVKEATEEGGKNILHSDLEIEPSEDAYVSPLVYAIEMDRTEIAEYLIDSGYDTTSDNNKAIKTAVRLKNLKIIDKLLEVNKDYPSYLETALLSSVTRTNVEFVKMFLDKGANVHFKNEAALVNAIGRQNDDIIKLLLSKGADLEKAIPQCTPIGQVRAKKYRKQGLFNKLINFKGFNKSNESVRDMMTPKSEEDIANSMKGITFYRAGKVYNSLITKGSGKITENILKYLPLVTQCHHMVFFNPKLDVSKYLKEGWISMDWKKQKEPEELTNLSFEVIVKKNKRRFLVSQHKTNRYLHCSFFNSATNRLDIATIRTIKEFLNLLNDKGIMNESVRDTNEVGLPSKVSEGLLRSMMTPRPKEEVLLNLDNLTAADEFNYLRSAIMEDDDELAKLILDRDNLSMVESGYILAETAIDCLNLEILEVILKKGLSKPTMNELIHYTEIEYRDSYKSIRDSIINLIDKYIGLKESIRDMMTPKSPEEIERIQRMLFDKTHMGWYEEYLKIKPLVDEAYEYIKSCGFRMVTEPKVYDYNTGSYGFKFDNNFDMYVGNDFRAFSLIYEFTSKKYMLSTWRYDKVKVMWLDIISYDDIEPWYNRETEKLSLISKLKSRLKEITKNDEHKKVLESVRDMMTPKPKEEMKKIIERLPERERLAKGINMGIYDQKDIDEMLNGLSPREYFIRSFMIERNIPFKERKLLPKVQQLIKSYKRIRVGDLLTVATPSINHISGKGDYPPLMKIIQKITFKSRDEFFGFIKEYQRSTSADVFADDIIKDIYRAYSWKKVNAVVVERKHWSRYGYYEKHKSSYIIYDYGVTTGVFTYTKKELEEGS